MKTNGYAKSIINLANRLLLSLAVLFGSAATVRSDTRTWDGSYSPWWSDSQNWVGNVAPAPGDDLVFPVGAGNLLNANDLGSDTYRSITISGSGYTLQGVLGDSKTIGLTHGIQTTAAGSMNTVDLNIELKAWQSFECVGSSALYVNGDVDLGSDRLSTDGYGSVHLGGVISGSGGGLSGSGLSKKGGGTTWLEGASANTYTGETWVSDGTLMLAKANGLAIPHGRLRVGDGPGSTDSTVVREQGNNQIGIIPITIHSDGWLDVDDYIDTVGSITFDGCGHAGSTALGTLSLGGNVVVEHLMLDRPAIIDGRLDIGSSVRTFDVGNGPEIYDLDVSAIISGSGGLVKTGSGSMRLRGASTYTGTTTVNQAYIYVDNGSAFGSTSAGTTVTGDGGIVLMDNAAVGNEELILERPYTGDNTEVFYARENSSWAGSVILNVDVGISTDGNLEFSGAISGPGGITFLDHHGGDSVTFSGSSPNTYAGDTHVNLIDGTLYLDKQGGGALPGPGDLYVGDGVSAWDSIVVQWLRSFQIDEDVDINVIPSGKLDLNGHNDFVGNLNLTSAGIETGSGLMGLCGDITATRVTNRNAFVSGNMALMPGTRTLHVIDNATLSLSAQVSGSGSLLKTGDGNLSLYSSNTFAGVTTVAEGGLFVANDHALGGTTARTVVLDGADIQLGNVRVEEPLTLYGDGAGYGALRHYGSGVTNSWAGSITLASDAAIGVPLDFANVMNLSGIISGQGSLTKKGAGTLMLTGSGSNIHAGDTIVEEGILLMGKNTMSIPNSLIIGGNDPGDPAAIAQNIAASEIGGNVIVNTSGFYDLGCRYESIQDLILYGGADVGMDTEGYLVIRGDVNVDPLSVSNASSSISGNLSLWNPCTLTVAQNYASIGNLPDLVIDAVIWGDDEIVKEGSGELQLTATNLFSGPFTLNAGSLWLKNDLGLGTTAAGISVNGNAYLKLDGFDLCVIGEPLILNSAFGSWGTFYSPAGSNSWTGDITLQSNTRIGCNALAALNLTGSIGGPGDLVKVSDGTLILSGLTANTYTGNTSVNRGKLVLDKTIHNSTILGNLYIGDGIGGADADIVQLGGTTQIGINTRITIADSGLLDMNNKSESFGSLKGSGRVDMGSGDLGTGNNNDSTTYSGLIEGSGELWKVGVGTFTLTGNNTYSGDTVVNSGTLLVNGSQPSSDVTVVSSGTLGGTGTVGAINSDGTVAPGTSAGQLGSGTVTMDSATFEVELDGYASTGYDRLNVIGTVSLVKNPQLVVSLGYMPAVDDKFTIINNDGTDAVVGIFDGLPDGAKLRVGNANLQIDYGSLKLNDVVLTVTDVKPLEPLQITSIGTASGDVEMAWEGGVPFYVVEKTTNLTNGTWTAVFGPTRDMAASLPADTTNGFYRVKGGN